MPTEPPFERLAQLADWHERQGDPSARPLRRMAVISEHVESAALFRRMLGKRAAADPKRLTLVGSLPLDAPSRWCERHGYRLLTTWAAVGVIAQRGDETPIVARLGDTLLWDGERITVLERTSPSRPDGLTP
ncbi:hypothetical protein AB0M41_38895 [Streptomyces sp. NPDC051896]|uniref:hypothetical protein n=1 Tax=Streptomyces sp. NPDC051896 TaxID=3155416 RepID=UPI0034252EFF